MDREELETMPYDDFDYGITVLLSPNGVGKTTTLLNIQRELSDNQYIKTILYSHHDESCKTSKGASKLDFSDRFTEDVINSFFVSEGQELEYSFVNWLTDNVFPIFWEIKEKGKTQYKELVLLIDELDSGLSIDKIKNAIEVFPILIDDAKKYGIKLKIILTANSYELASEFKENAIWILSKKKIDISTYNKFQKQYIDYYNKQKEEEK